MTWPLFELGDRCPCQNCKGVMALEDYCAPDEATVQCPECGYCPEDEFDGRIKNCPACRSWTYIINQRNIICSGCNLELTADNEEDAIRAWNSIGRQSYWWQVWCTLLWLSYLLMIIKEWAS